MNAEELILKRISEIPQEALQGFSSGSESLDTFLADSAREYDQFGLTFTTLVFLGADPVPIAYFSLSNDSIRLSDSEKFDLGIGVDFEVQVRSFPAVKITRLAIDKNWQSRGIGSCLIEIIEGIVFGSSTAARFLVVDAINNPRAIKFYVNMGFIDSLAQKPKIPNPETVCMFRDLYSED